MAEISVIRCGDVFAVNNEFIPKTLSESLPLGGRQIPISMVGYFINRAVSEGYSVTIFPEATRDVNACRDQSDLDDIRAVQWNRPPSTQPAS